MESKEISRSTNEEQFPLKRLAESTFKNTTALSARVSNNLPVARSLSRLEKYSLFYPGWKKKLFNKAVSGFPDVRWHRNGRLPKGTLSLLLLIFYTDMLLI